MSTTGNRPFQRMVILGDSIAYGMCAHDPSNEWNQVVAGLIRKFQAEPLTVFNRGLPASVISPRCTGHTQSAKPSLLERYQQHCIDLHPDLVIVADGLNAMRSGMNVQDYMADLNTITADIQAQTGALVVLVGIYHQIFGQGGNDPATRPIWTKWDHNTAQIYNLAIGLIAQKCNALFVDALTVLNRADWVLHPDACHLNDLGHVLIGNAIFQVIATHTSSLAHKTLQIISSQAVTTLNTGGTDTNEEIQTLWLAALERFNTSNVNSGVRFNLTPTPLHPKGFPSVTSGEGRKMTQEGSPKSPLPFMERGFRGEVTCQ